MAWAVRNHYNQKHTPAAKAKRTYDGIEFDSLAEMQRYRDHLKPMYLAGGITDLELQPRFYLDVFDYRLGFYTADFRYRDRLGNLIVEEVKGRKEERDFSIKWKLVQVLFPEYRWVFVRADWTAGRYVFSIKKREPVAIKNPAKEEPGKP